MSQPEGIKSLSKDDDITIRFKSTGMYNAGTSETHTGTVVKKLTKEDSDPFDYKIIYRTDDGEVFLLEGKVEYIYTHENDKLRQLKGINAKIVPDQEYNGIEGDEE